MTNIYIESSEKPEEVKNIMSYFVSYFKLFFKRTLSIFGLKQRIGFKLGISLKLGKVFSPTFLLTSHRGGVPVFFGTGKKTSKGGQKDVKKWSKGGQIDYRGLGGRIRLLERFDKGTRFLCESGKNYKSLRKIIKLLVRPLPRRSCLDPFYKSFYQQKILGLGGFLFRVARKSRTPELPIKNIMSYFKLFFKRTLSNVNVLTLSIFTGGRDETCTRSLRMVIPGSFCKRAHISSKTHQHYRKCNKLEIDLFYKSFYKQKIPGLGGFLFRVAGKSRASESTIKNIMSYFKLFFKRTLSIFGFKQRIGLKLGISWELILSWEKFFHQLFTYLPQGGVSPSFSGQAK